MEYGKTTINTEKIALGVLGMIKEHPQGECIQLGMLPADIMESLERSMIIKLAFLDDADDLTTAQLKELAGQCMHGGVIVSEIVKDAMREISSKVISYASASGLCVV
jgi:hypothetical protein